LAAKHIIMSKPIKAPSRFTAVRERQRKLWNERHPDEPLSNFPDPFWDEHPLTEDEPEEEEDTSHFREVDNDNPGWRSWLW
jgi:hypothetical protein